MLSSCATFTMISVGIAIGVIAAGLLERLVALPLPAHGSVQDIPVAKMPNPKLLADVCPPLSLRQEALLKAVILFDGLVHGSESVAVHPNGTLYMLDKYGYLQTADPDAGTHASLSTGAVFSLHPAPAAYVGPGRPLAFHVDSSGNLIICDSLKGLTMLTNSGNLTILANRVSKDSPLDAGTALSYVNDLDISGDGMVYFSDSSAVQPIYNHHRGHWDTLEAYMLTMFKGEPSGRLLRYDPGRKSTHVLATGIWYSNGVAISQDGTFIVVAETCGMRLLRHWVEGPKVGQTEVFVEGLPGFPDGVTRSHDGHFYVALLLPPLKALRLLPSKLLRLALAWLPTALRPKAQPWGMVLKVSVEGVVTDCLTDMHGAHISGISAVTQHGSRLYFGNLVGSYVSYLHV